MENRTNRIQFPSKWTDWIEWWEKQKKKEKLMRFNEKSL
jgi:hypothetical protein